MAAHEAMVDSAAPSIVMVRTFDAPLVVYTGDTSDEEALSAWITEKSIPLVTELDSSPKNRDVLRKLFASSLPKALLFADFAASDTKLVRIQSGLLVGVFETAACCEQRKTLPKFQ